MDTLVTLFSIGLTLIVAAAVTWIPGSMVLVAARRSPITVAAAAPVLTCGVVYIGSATADALGVGWSVWWLLLTAGVVAGVVYLAGRFVEPWWQRRVVRSTEEASRPLGAPWTRGAWIAVVIVGLTATVVALYAYYATTGRFTVIPQDFDSVFQANAIRQIADSGVATPDSLGEINSYDSAAGLYYPSVFHALAALTFQITGTGVLGATHAHIMLWFLMIPLGVLAVLRRTRVGAFGAGAALVASAAFTSLPFDLIWRGLLPFALSLVLVLPVLALLVTGLRRRRFLDAVLVALAILGVVSVHTSGATTIALWCALAVVALIISERRRFRAVLVWLGLLVVLTVLALVPTALAMASFVGETDLDWPAILLPIDGIWSALFFGTGYREDNQLTLAVLVLAGAVLAFRRKYSWLWAVSISLFMAMGLYVLAVSVDNSISLALTRWWWNDQLRLSALVTIGAPLLVAVTADSVKSAGVALWRRIPAAAAWQDRTPRGAQALSLTLCAALLALFVANTDTLYFERNRDAVAFKYQDGPTVSRLEAEAMAELARIVPPGQRVMNDFRDGSAWMFALEGVHPVWGAVNLGDNEGRRLLDRELNTLATNPAVADELRSRDIHYVFLGAGFVLAGMERAPGLEGIADQPDMFELVYSNPDAQIYRIVGID